MIIFAELAMVDRAHVQFNSSIIKLFQSSNNEEVLFFGEKKHVKYLKENLSEYNYGIEFKTFICPDVRGNKFIRSVRILTKEIVFILNLLRILISAKFNKPRYIIVTGALPIVHLFIKLIYKQICSNQKIVIVLHGEIESIINKPNSYYQILKRAILKDVKGIKYIVLNELIKKNIVEHFNLIPEQIIAIDHPYNYNISDLNLSSSKALNTFGSIGIHSTRTKCSHLIFQLAKLVNSSMVKFKTVGIFEPDMHQYLNSYVDISATSEKKMLSNEDFQEQILSLDFILIFYPPNSYKFISSGIFFDAIKYKKPIISLKNDFTEYYFNILGNIGYLVSNIEEMKSLINKIVNENNHEKYLIQQQNLYNAQQLLSIEKIKENLSSQLNKI